EVPRAGERCARKGRTRARRRRREEGRVYAESHRRPEQGCGTEPLRASDHEGRKAGHGSRRDHHVRDARHGDGKPGVPAHRDLSRRLLAAHAGTRHGRALGALVQRHAQGRAAVHRRRGRPRNRMTAVRQAVSLVAFALGAVVALAAVPLPLADGDPARDLLLSQASYLSPYDGHISSSQQKRIEALLQSATKQGFPLKAAVIVTRYDLGAVPILYRKPQTYAKFLAQEDFYFWKDELLVVMPNGYGLYKLKGLPAQDKAVLAKLPKFDTTNGPALANAAERAVVALAARRGLTLSTGTGSGGTSVWVERGEIAGGALVICAIGAAAVFLRRRRAVRASR